MKKTYLLILVGLIFTFYCLFHFQSLRAQNKSALEDLQQDKLKFSPQQSGELKQVPRMIINSKTAGAIFEQRDLFQSEMKSAADFARVSEAVSEGIVVKPELAAMQRVLTEKNQFLTLPVPDGKGGIIELEVSKVNNFAPNFLINTSSPTDESLDEAVGVHYRGIIKGNAHSLVAISIFKTEVMGFFSTDSDGNSVIGRLSGKNPSNSHIIYNDRNLNTRPKVFCNTNDITDTNLEIPEWMLEEPQEVLARCIRIYIEADYNVFLNKGSVANTISYLTGLFNQSATLYSNEGISIIISEIFVWSSQSPYSGTSSIQFLGQFHHNRPNFNGDLAHLVSLQTLGGVANGIGTLCNPNQVYNFSSISANYINVPTYSWSVEVMAHEMGHTFGSNHTHACVWNGNNTAIDSCGPAAGLSEGNCSGAPLPTQTGGTIMSYCHLVQGVGINFYHGFGPQPRNAMLNSINNSTCLIGCGGGTNNRKTAGVFRPSDGITYMRNSNNGGDADISMIYGIAGDQSFAGDWNGDHIDSIGIYRNGVFYLRNSNTTGPADMVFAFGADGDQPVAGDWNHDGIDTIGVYRPSTGVFMLRNSNTAGAPEIIFVLGNPGDVAIVGDWNNDGIDTTGVFRPTNGIVYLKNTNVSGIADIYLVYGVAGDKPLAGDWDGDGIDSVGIYRDGLFYLRNSNTQGVADMVFALGNPGDEPIAGDWDGLP